MNSQASQNSYDVARGNDRWAWESVPPGPTYVPVTPMTLIPISTIPVAVVPANLSWAYKPSSDYPYRQPAPPPLSVGESGFPVVPPEPRRSAAREDEEPSYQTSFRAPHHKLDSPTSPPKVRYNRVVPLPPSPDVPRTGQKQWSVQAEHGSESGVSHSCVADHHLSLTVHARSNINVRHACAFEGLPR